MRDGRSVHRRHCPSSFCRCATARHEVGGLAPEGLQQVLVTEYAPGAPIGWHRDKPEFQDVVAISFLAPCLLRFRRRRCDGWQRRSLDVMPRSAYVLSGAARTEWEHSIPPLSALRYSVTFRNLRDMTSSTIRSAACSAVSSTVRSTRSGASGTS